MSQIKKFAVIVAGGKGVRMGSALPKQFLLLLGKPMLHYSISAFVTAFPDIELVLVLPHHQLSYGQIVLQSFPEGLDITIIAGGETRFHSVQNGLQVVEDNSIVFVHDGARPLVSPDLIQHCYNQALEKGSAIPAIPVAESMRIQENEQSKPVNREHLRIVQTPQTFRSDVILPAFKQHYQALFTDEATVVEANGTEIFLINGEQNNIKVTTPGDMVIAEALLKARSSNV